MTRILLTESQALAIHSASGPVEICDPTGHVITVVGSQSDEAAFIAEALRRRDEPGPRLTTKQVLEYLETLAPSGQP